ncbi:MAG: hypothetical protein IT495_13190 [Gammaproteobacteria bacterium]|nr:hypothetical protein [Gammaproteobacteria bacterium]
MKTAPELLRVLGPLRSMMLAIVVLLVLSAPIATGDGPRDGWRFVPALLSPVFATIMAFVLPLDFTMSRVQMGEYADGPHRERYRLISRIDLGALALLLLAWLPFVLRMLRS